jgi:orotate phosphoribosyltransferase
MTKEQALVIFRKSEALLEGHFKLTSGLHSNQYFQCAKVLQYPRYAEQLCQEIANKFAAEKVDCVISPAIGGIVAGQEVARLLGVRSIFAERVDNKMVIRRGFEIKDGERILAVEDVVTTGGSVKEVIEHAKSLGANIIGAAFIVDRSGGKADFDVPFFSVFQMDVKTYQPDECPLCEKGIEIVKPGSRKIF